MLIRSLFCLSIFAFGLIPFARAEDAGFQPLFGESGLKGWRVVAEKPVGENHWTWADGLLSAKTGSTWLRSEKMYGNFILRLEWRVPENGNSGVFLRVPELGPGEHPWDKGMEIQILDDGGSQYVGKLKPWQFTGSIYGVVPAQDSKHLGPGKWQRFELTCRGDEVRVVFNGRIVSSADMSQRPELKDRPRKGFLGLQNHGTPIEFRNLSIRELD